MDENEISMPSWVTIILVGIILTVVVAASYWISKIG